MRLELGARHADFLSQSGVLAGRYHFDSAFKPYLAPLNTPKGHNLVLAMSHDHKHQRGVMYAVRARDVNWWEERVVREGEAIGFVRHERLGEMTVGGGEVSLSHTLLWTDADGLLDSFRETRTLLCGETGEGFAWRWQAEIVPLRDVRLVFSQWADKRPDGSRVNYHGLGFRFIRDFDGAFGKTRTIVDGRDVAPADAMGSRPHTVTLAGAIDGFEAAPNAGVTIRQTMGHGMFLMTEPYPLLSLGPSNLSEVTMKAGEPFAEDFEFVVFDGEPNTASET